jgi:hypothetical protein
MFLTKDDLKLAYGVDLEIGAVYVDRPVPVNNLYWKGRTIYTPGAPGYIFMPIFADILFRCGAEKKLILSNDFISINEKILHSAALLEHQQISWQEHARQLNEDLRPHAKNPSLFDALSKYLGQPAPQKMSGSPLGTNFPSLNRADTYLYSLACIDSPMFDQAKAISGWYALMTYFLILDDLADIKDDLIKGEDNVLIDVGLNASGIEKVNAMIDDSMSAMLSINAVMANRIEHKKTVIDLEEIIRSITA